MKNLSQVFTLGLLILGMTSLTACSSSKVEDGEAPVETTEATNAEQPLDASTDIVPEATPDIDPSLDAGSLKTEEVLAVAPTNSDEIVPEPIIDSATPIADAPPVEAPMADAPIIENAPTAETVVPAPVAMEETRSTPTQMDGTPYRVKKGDTLMKIAFEQYGDLYRWKEIYESNRSNIKNPNHVPPGTELTLNGAGMVTIEKNGQSYLIKGGDTLSLISSDVYGTARKWKRLWENNRQLIKDPNKIYAGFYLYYQPEGKLTHDDIAPGLKKDDSAMNQTQVSEAPREPASEPAKN